MSEKISALMDGELAPQQAQPVIDVLLADAGQNETWRAYHLIGEAMRRNPAVSVDVRQQVVLQLATEPTVFAPAAIRQSRPLRRYAAVAASMAFVATIGWVGWQETRSDMVVAQAVDTSDVLNPTAVEGVPYLAAHQEMAAGSGLYRVGLATERQVAGHR